MVPVRESIRKVSKANMPKSELKVVYNNETLKVRPVIMADFLQFTDLLYSTTETLQPILEPLD
jgi:hypothetical protein